MRRFTRLTNGFSKRVANHAHMVALYFVWYNWVRVHKTLGMTPAMAAGLAGQPYTLVGLAKRIEERTKPGPRGPYKPRMGIYPGDYTGVKEAEAMSQTAEVRVDRTYRHCKGQG